MQKRVSASVRDGRSKSVGPPDKWKLKPVGPSGLPGSPDENRKVCKKRRNVAKMLRTKVTNRGVELDRKYDMYV